MQRLVYYRARLHNTCKRINTTFRKKEEEEEEIREREGKYCKNRVAYDLGHDKFPHK